MLATRFVFVSWEVLHNVKFPKNMRLKQAWLCWRQGFPNYHYNKNSNIAIVKIESFCKIKPALLPKKVRSNSKMSSSLFFL